MIKCNIEIVREYDLVLDDLILINAIELFANEKDLDNDNKFELSYDELIKSLPILFRSSERSNVAKLRKMLNNENMQSFVKREISQQGRGKGALVTFTINRDLISKLKIRGLLS